MRTAIILLLALVYSGCEQKPSSMPEQAPAEKSAPAVETEVTKTVEETPAMDEPAEKAEQTPAAAAEPETAPVTGGSGETESDPAAVKSTPVSGETLFKLKCASCHGEKAERSALGKSQIIAGWERQRIIDAVKGYQAETYGNGMKQLMTAQVSMLTDQDIEILADYISAQ